MYIFVIMTGFKHIRHLILLLYTVFVKQHHALHYLLFEITKIEWKLKVSTDRKPPITTQTESGRAASARAT